MSIIRKDSYSSLLDEMTKMWVSLGKVGLALPKDWQKGLKDLREMMHVWDFNESLMRLEFEAGRLFRAATRISIQETVGQTLRWIDEVICMWSRDREKLSLEIGTEPTLSMI